MIIILFFGAALKSLVARYQLNCAKLSEEALKTNPMKLLFCNNANSQHFSGATLKTDSKPGMVESQFLRMSETGRRTNGKRKRLLTIICNIIKVTQYINIFWHTSKLYNIVNYEVRKNDIKPIYTRLDKQFKSNWHCDWLHSHNRQHCLKQLAQDWKSYFSSLKEYKENPNKYKGQPKPPNYKHMDNNPNQVIYTNLATRIRDSKLLLSVSKEIKSKYGVDSLKFELPPVV